MTSLPTPLGAIGADRFMRRIWQREPCVVRQAVPQPSCIDRQTLLRLAARTDVESRLVRRHGRQWTLTHGPLARSAVPPMSQPNWTLLVQGVDTHVDAVHRLMQRFDFVPWARLDDVMVSLAGDGGGVGPHTDDYDVFLLQLNGRRRWRVGPVAQARWRRDTPLKQLSRFEAMHDWTLEPGDMLYVPPGWGHDGTAVGPCMTASIGFRAPRAGDLARELLSRLADDDEAFDAMSASRYVDPRQGASERPGAIPAALSAFARQSVAQALESPGALTLALGEWLTEPKPDVVFDAQGVDSDDVRHVDGDAAPGHRVTTPRRGALVLDRRTRMLYDADLVFINGESVEVSGADATALRVLADRRRLPGAAWRTLSASARRAVAIWIRAGWMHDVTPEASDLTSRRSATR